MVTKWLNGIFSNQTQAVSSTNRGATRVLVRRRSSEDEKRGEDCSAADTIRTNGNSHANGEYVLATGTAAANRLNILHELYETGTCHVLLDAGLRRGMRVADLGCGIGTVTKLIGDFVGPEGYVVGMDASEAQVAEARSRLSGKATNIRFVEASALDTGWPDESFDMVYCRFLLLHLCEPEQALREMHRLLKPGGVIVCEDGDLTSAGSEPASALCASRICSAGWDRSAESITHWAGDCTSWSRPPDLLRRKSPSTSR